MLVNRNKLGSDGLEIQEAPGSEGSIVTAQHLFQKQTQGVLDIPEFINIELLELIEKIPYHAWGGALNMNRSKILTAIPDANYSTLVAVCQKFLRFPESYWNDNRDRNFSGITEAIELRLTTLGYTVIETEVRHYLNDTNMKRLNIPTEIRKI